MNVKFSFVLFLYAKISPPPPFFLFFLFIYRKKGCICAWVCQSLLLLSILGKLSFFLKPPPPPHTVPHTPPPLSLPPFLPPTPTGHSSQQLSSPGGKHVIIEVFCWLNKHSQSQGCRGTQTGVVGVTLGTGH